MMRLILIYNWCKKHAIWFYVGLVAILAVALELMRRRRPTVIDATQQADKIVRKDDITLRTTLEELAKEKATAVSVAEAKYESAGKVLDTQVQQRLDDDATTLVERMKKRGRGPLIVLLCLAGLPTARADWQTIGLEKPPAELYGDDRILHLKAGKTTPYEGIFLDLATAARMDARAEWYEERLRLDTSTLRNRMTLEIAFADARYRELTESKARVIEALREDIRQKSIAAEKAKSVPFYRKALFGGLVGSTLGIVLGVWVTARVVR